VRLTLHYLVRWLAWQLGEHDPPLAAPEARITVFSSPDRRLRRQRSA
jgi:hypothetical protein